MRIKSSDEALKELWAVSPEFHSLPRIRFTPRAIPTCLLRVGPITNCITLPQLQLLRILREFSDEVPFKLFTYFRGLFVAIQESATAVLLTPDEVRVQEEDRHQS